jgi:hypothetical protein
MYALLTKLNTEIKKSFGFGEYLKEKVISAVAILLFFPDSIMLTILSRLLFCSSY